MADDLKSLIKARGHIKATVTKFKTYCDSLNDGSNLTQTRIRLKKFEGSWDEFKTIQNKIEDLDDSVQQKDERDSFEFQYFELTTKAEEFLDKMSISATPSLLSTNNSASLIEHSQGSAIQLPRLNLPHFSGQYQEWVSFFETFNSLIHDDAKLNNIQKLHYLKSCLKNEAASLIQGLGMSNSNYSTALDLLKERYENKRLIMKSHVRALCHLPTVVKNSAESLRKLLNVCKLNLKLLKNLNQPVEHWDLLLIENITDKLDYTTIHDWEKTKIAGDVPTLKELMDFLSEKCQLLESLDPAKSSHCSLNSNNQTNKQTSKPKLPAKADKIATYVATRNPRSLCYYCKQEHFTNHCPDLIKLSVESRVREINNKNLCINCLRGNHLVDFCKSIIRCKECKEKHHTLLHGVDKACLESSSVGQDTITTVNNYSNNHNTYQVLLSTALVNVRGADGRFHLIRALLDSGSQSNFITASACQKLGLKHKNISVQITGITKSLAHATNAVDIWFKSHATNYSATCSCVVLNTITDDLPSLSFNKGQVRLPKYIKLADPNFNTSGPIDMLIGKTLSWQIILAKPVQIDGNTLQMMDTKLGWIIGGDLVHKPPNIDNTLCHVSIQSIDDQIKRFWEIENCELNNSTESEQSLCERHFVNTHARNQHGRFVVSLPFKPNAPELGDSRELALKRFYALERKLKKNPDLKNEYSSFMQEYISLGHMSEVPLGEIETNLNSVFYLPHHAVIKESSATTRLRVVYDGSMKTTNGVSLNDTLCVGPKIQDDLIYILIRFRLFRYAFSADIAKMYRMVLVASEDRNFQRVFWRNNQNDPLKTYTLNTVTYGTAPAAFLAIRSIRQLAAVEREKNPLAHGAILNNFYVDDLLSGANNVTEALELQRQLSNTLRNGGFELRKWAANDPRLIPINCTNSQLQTHLSKETETKLLGLIWDSSLDVLKYSIKRVNADLVTKRIILSTVAQLFDPMGLICPVIVNAKIILQKLWSLQVDWDASLPLDLTIKWKEFISRLPVLNELKISRRLINNHDKFSTYELHGYCDASQAAYGACVYLRAISSDGNITTNLIAAKSRVAPLKALTIPRLELCGALLLAKLSNQIKDQLDLKFSRCVYWTDSTIVLSWLSAVPSTWKIFVSNRVHEIQTLTDTACWHHISGKDNPADIISRGLSPLNLINSELWWHGPNELVIDNPFTKVNSKPNLVNVPEIRVTHMVSVIPEWEIITKFSNFNKLQCVMAYCLRFIHNLKLPNSKLTSRLSARELEDAKTVILRYVQHREFANDLTALTKAGRVKSSSKILTLSPFLDEKRLIRVGGRLKNSHLHYDKKHPVLLPANHHLTKIIIRHIHETNYHAGQQATLAFTRQCYWPVSARSVIRKIVHNCVRCFRTSPRVSTQPMGNLPDSRIQPTRPFMKSGVDFAGPLYLKQSRGRSKGVIKAYICLFICLATKAVHMELVSDLTTQAFINALKRFIGRRGLIAEIHCDNATNFKGAQRELNELHSVFYNNNKLLDHSAKLGLTWHFIPPRSPHFGGLWEAGIKSAKYLLKRILGNACLNYDEMYTVLVGIEAILNSRPLIPLSNDPNDFQALTPGHFLIGAAINALPEPDTSHLKLNRLSRWQHVERLRQDFWKRWSTEYLTNLQTKYKWNSNPTFSYKIGMLVLIRDDNQPPLQWKLGRIIALHPGRDSITRVVTLKTSLNEMLRRATAKVCVLPIKDNEKCETPYASENQ